MQMPTVSIVVPIYKVERYIEKCLDSLVKQTLHNIEIILVDDGTPDQSGAIADKWAQTHSNIKVIHQDNQGYGTAVNNGINQATGEFVAIIEPDDWVEHDMFNRLYTKAKRFNAEAARCGFYIYDSTKPKGKQDEIWSETQELLSQAPKGVFAPIDFPILFDTHSAIWTYIFRRELLNRIKLDTSRKAYQDMPFIFEMLTTIKQMVIVPKCLHHYRMELGQGSSSMSKSVRALDMIDMTILSRERIKDSALYPLIRDRFYRHCVKANQYFWDRTPDEKRDIYTQAMHDFFVSDETALCKGMSGQFVDWFNKIRWYRIPTEMNEYKTLGSRTVKWPNDCVHIAYCSDAKGIPFLSVSLQSLIEHTHKDRRYIVHIVTTELDCVAAGYLKRQETENVKIDFIDASKCADLSKELFIDRHLTQGAYWRLFLPQLLPSATKVVYLDCDTIICDDIGKLFDLDISEYFIGGCKDIAVDLCNFGDFKFAKETLANLDYKDYSRYINSGILLMNLEKWRISK